VGDEYGKDVVGARGAGWNAILIDHGGSGEGKEGGELEWLGDGPLEEVFPLDGPPRAVRSGSVQGVLTWLGKEVRRGKGERYGM
jgi:hypothetical protein